MNRAYRFALVLLQATLAFGLILGFFSWAPWITCQPISELSATAGGVDAPEWARCFNNNRGNVVFSDRPPLAEEPRGFYALSAGLITCFVVLLVANYWYRRLDPGGSDSV